MTISSLPAQFVPASNIVTAITNAVLANVSTQTAHGYTVGQFVRLYIPLGFGMPQANEQQVLINSVPTSTTFVCTLNTSTLSPFSIPMNATQQAQVVPIGEVAQSLQASKRNILGNPQDLPY